MRWRPWLGVVAAVFVLSTVIAASCRIGAARICSRHGFRPLVRVDVPGRTRQKMKSCGCSIFSRWPIVVAHFVRPQARFCDVHGTAADRCGRQSLYVFLLGIFLSSEPIRLVESTRDCRCRSSQLAGMLR